MKKPKFEVDKIQCSATNGKFELVVFQSSGGTWKVVDASTCHPFQLQIDQSIYTFADINLNEFKLQKRFYFYFFVKYE